MHCRYSSTRSSVDADKPARRVLDVSHQVVKEKLLNLVILENSLDMLILNSIPGTRHNVGPLRKLDGELTTDPAIKAELLGLSAYFSSVFTTVNGS